MSKTIVILRFRDLVVPTPGHTISEHTGLIKQFGYTWWGWWKKQAEKVPEATWSNLIREVEANRIGDLYLLDSGQRKLYKAELLDVFMQERGIPFDAGERDYRYSGGGVYRAPLLRFDTDDVGIDVAVFPSSDLRRALLSPIDGQPMKRLTLAQAEALASQIPDTAIGN